MSKLQENLQEMGFNYCRPVDVPITITSPVDKAVWISYKERINLLWAKIWNLLAPTRVVQMVDMIKSALSVR